MADSVAAISLPDVYRRVEDMEKTVLIGQAETRSILRRQYEDFDSFRKDFGFFRDESKKMMTSVESLTNMFQQVVLQLSHLDKIKDIASDLHAIKDGSLQHQSLLLAHSKELLAQGTLFGKSGLRAQTLVGHALMVVLFVAGIAVIGTLLGVTGYDINFGNGSNVFEIKKSKP